LKRPAFLLAALSLLAVLPALAQQPKAPPFMLSAEDRAQLDQKSKALADRLSAVQGSADAGVFLHVAQMADRLDLYANRNQVNSVLRGLDTGLQRAEQLSQGKHPWTEQPGKSLRGYVSRIDNSVQPYGVTLPAGFDPAKTYPLHVVLHGRGPTEVSFLGQMEPANPSQNKAPNQEFIELEPFGRANNGWRWAGETDVFEALDQVQHQYHIDPNRIVLRGFSMGGHGGWQIGIHYPTMWSAVSPGAGFTDTRKYQKIPEGSVPAYVEQGWHIYDAVDYARNVFDSLFVGYGGEKDPQLQASLNMKEAAAKEGLDLKVIIGPGVEHRYHPDSFKEIMQLVQAPVRDPLPKEIRFVTYTLKYNKCGWLTIDELDRHYERAQVDGVLKGDAAELTTKNVGTLSLALPNSVKSVVLDGQKLAVPAVAKFRRRGGKWGPGGGLEPHAPLLHKRHNLQGPIDDAFMERFLVVRPTGQAWHPATAEFAEAGVKRFSDEWRFGFRGELPVKDDRQVTEADWKDANLVLWGDPGSNSVLAKIAKSLPVKWTAQGLTVYGKSYGPDALPVLIFPNPLNHERYVVINSGHTFNRKDLDASNAQLYPHLPDWAVIKPSGEVLAADYFDEFWGFRR
jgi:hypothetical protein